MRAQPIAEGEASGAVGAGVGPHRGLENPYISRYREWVGISAEVRHWKFGLKRRAGMIPDLWHKADLEFWYAHWQSTSVSGAKTT